jgi:hypothetical protein
MTHTAVLLRQSFLKTKNAQWLKNHVFLTKYHQPTSQAIQLHHQLAAQPLVMIQS